MSDFIIRPADVEDADQIAFIHVTSWQETYSGIVPDSFLESLSVDRRAVQWMRSLSDPDDLYHAVLVAEVGGQVVGFANYGMEREKDKAYQGELFALYLLRGFQGGGIGKALFQGSMQSLRVMGIFSMLVWVLSENPARKFYEHIGGKFLREKAIQIGDVELFEAAYGYDPE